MINIQQYKPHSELTKEILKDNNFKYIDGYYSYRFPVYKYKRTPIIWCNLYMDLENKTLNLNVFDENNNTYASFFNRTYGGENKVVESVEKKIKTQLGVFVKNKILKKVGNK